MSWKAGSILFSDIIIALNEQDLEDDVRKKVYDALIPAFENMDCDALQDCMGEDDSFDEALMQAHPDKFSDVEDEDEYLYDEE